MVTINRYIKALLHPAGGHQGSHKAHQAGNHTQDDCRPLISRVSCQIGPIRHAYAWQIGPFWQDTLDIGATSSIYRQSF